MILQSYLQYARMLAAEVSWSRTEFWGIWQALCAFWNHSYMWRRTLQDSPLIRQVEWALIPLLYSIRFEDLWNKNQKLLSHPRRNHNCCGTTWRIIPFQTSPFGAICITLAQRRFGLNGEWNKLRGVLHFALKQVSVFQLDRCVMLTLGLHYTEYPLIESWFNHLWLWEFYTN